MTSAAKIVVRWSILSHDEVSGRIAFAAVIEMPKLLPLPLAAFVFDASSVFTPSGGRR
jgi:hypothetical protein